MLIKVYANLINYQNNMENTQQPGKQLQVKVNDDILKGVYANMLQIGHTQEEFVLDFMNVYPPAGTLNSRIIVSPAHMKRIVAALQDNLKKYEKQFGTVESSAQPEQHIGFKTE